MGTVLPELPLEPTNFERLPQERIALRAWATAYGEACYEAGRQSVIEFQMANLVRDRMYPVGSAAFEKKVDEAMVIYRQAVEADRQPISTPSPIVEAIKWLRNETGCGLKNAKEAIDRKRGI